jgi:hypothetical protein
MSSAAVEQDARPVAAEPASQDRYWLLLFRKNGSELLVANKRPPFTLPCVEIPRWERPAENLTSVVKKRFGIPAVCLFTPSSTSADAKSSPPLYQLLETRSPHTNAPHGMLWLPVNSLSAQSLAHNHDFTILATSLRQLQDFQSGERRGPFAKLGWIEEISSWLQHAVAPHGFHLTGEFRQLNASPTFALLRFETNSQALWFKAVDEPNLREFPISVLLSRLFPGRVPRVIATHSTWHAWVTEECPGSTLEELSNDEAWEVAAKSLATLQIESLDSIVALLETGCRDLRIPSLLDQVGPFLEVMEQLMKGQKTATVPILSPGEIRQLGTAISAALLALAQLEIPDTLGHLDFNPGNVLLSRDQCVVLDWCEAYVGNPLFTLEYLNAHLLRTHPANPILHSSVSASYTKKWGGYLDVRRLAKARRLAPMLAVFAYALSLDDWRDPRPLDQVRAAYFRSLTRRMYAEHLRVVRQEAPC